MAYRLIALDLDGTLTNDAKEVTPHTVAVLHRAIEKGAVVAAHFAGRLDIYRAESIYLEIMPRNIRKSTGLQRLMDHLGIRASELMACGDAHNDLPMMEMAGLSVAMENAYENVKKAAHFITKSNNEDGVAYAVEKFVLNGETA